MGNKTWTTDRQRQFLVDHLPRFEESSQKKKTQRFFEHFYDKYFREFPVDGGVPGVEVEIIRGLQKKVSRTATATLKPYQITDVTLPAHQELV